MFKSGVLGEAVFGTRRGLFAHGSGVLLGIENNPDVLEFRNSSPKLDIVPAEESFLLFRRALRASNRADASQAGESYDLIGVIKGVNDLGNRRGFFGFCVAVRAGDVAAYRNAFEQVADAFREAEEFYLDGRSFKDTDVHYFRDAEDVRRARERRFIALGKDAEPIVLAASWSETEDKSMVFSAIQAIARWGGSGTPTIAVFDGPRPGAAEITTALIERYRQAAETRERQAAEQRRQAALARQQRPAESRSDERLRQLEQRVQRLERHLYGTAAPVRHGEAQPETAERQEATGRGGGFLRQRYADDAWPDDDDAEDTDFRPSLKTWLLWGAMGLLVVLLTLLLLTLFFGEPQAVSSPML